MTMWGVIARGLSGWQRLQDIARERAYLGRLKLAGAGVRLARGIHIEHPEFVEIHAGAHLNEHCWISVIAPEPGAFTPCLTIGPGTYVGRFATLACMRRVTIGQRVLISDRVFVGDALHGHSRLDRAIADQPMVSPGPVEIGDGTWIGIGACVLPNVKIGRHCVIGANAVVTRDVPDYHVAVGVPARAVRRIDAHDAAVDRLP
jgi:acetyltransferase-like isoleucine patch superfamily enzyme